jgi:hypothetical protein
LLNARLTGANFATNELLVLIYLNFNLGDNFFGHDFRFVPCSARYFEQIHDKDYVKPPQRRKVFEEVCFLVIP